MEHEYDAYGKAWKYFTVERYTKSWGFGSTHGIFGIKERLEQFVYLVTPEGEKVPVHDRIYALQRDGSYKKVGCCDKVLTQADVYNFDKKLVVYFKQTWEDVTDCLIYPEGRPDDEKEPDPDKRYRYVQLFGEFDPQAKRFNVRDFLPDFSRKEFAERLGKNPSKEDQTTFFYSVRRPFICDRR